MPRWIPPAITVPAGDPFMRRVQLNTVGLHRCEPNWRQGPERTTIWTDLVLWLLLEGDGQAATPEGIYDLRPGSCLVMRGGEVYDFTQHPRRRFKHWYAHFNYLGRDGRPLPPAADPPPRHRLLDSYGFMVDLLERVAAACRTDGGDAHRWMEVVLWELARCDAVLARPADPQAGPIDDLIRRLRENPQAAPSVPAMATALGLSEDRFARRFRARAGMAPRSFVVQCRMDRARELLVDTELPVAGIAAACGFADPAFFCRQFAGHHAGCSPGAWRKARRSGGCR